MVGVLGSVEVIVMVGVHVGRLELVETGGTAVGLQAITEKIIIEKMMSRINTRL
jgi:hypothetical protein